MNLYHFIPFLLVFGVGINRTDTMHLFQDVAEGDKHDFCGVDNLLFYLARSPDRNVICYTANVDKEGKIVENDPVKVVWLRSDKVPKQKELTYLQKKLAYGVRSRQLDNGEFILTIVSFPQRTLRLKQKQGSGHQVVTAISGHQAILNKVFVKLQPQQGRIPKVEYIDLQGTKFNSGNTVKERIVL